MVGGSTSTLQLRLANRGHAPLPLCLSITAKVRKYNFCIWILCIQYIAAVLMILPFFLQSALSQLYFSFGEVPQSLVSALHPSLLGSSHLLHPHHHTLTLTLPPSPQPDKEHSDPEWYTINVCFHAPKKFINGENKAIVLSKCLDVVEFAPLSFIFFLHPRFHLRPWSP